MTKGVACALGQKMVISVIPRMAVGGGYIMAPAKQIMPGVPLENAVALIDAIVRQDRAFRILH